MPPAPMMAMGRGRDGAGQDCESSSLSVAISAAFFNLIREARRITIFHGLKMLAIEHQFAFVFENLIAATDQAELGVFGALLEIGADGVEGVADEDGFDEAKFVVAVA